MTLFSREKINGRTVLKVLGIKMSFKPSSYLKVASKRGFKTIYKNTNSSFPKDSKRILIHTYSIGFLLTQLAVVKNLYNNCKIDILLSSFSEETTQNILNLVKNIKNVNQLSLITSEYVNKFEKMQFKKHNSNCLEKIKNKFCKDFNSKNYDAVIYVYDICDSLIGIIKAIFPDIKLIITGDAIGFYYEKETQKKLYGHRINYNNVFEFVEPDIFMNILPVPVYKKDLTAKTEIKILPKEDYINNFVSFTDFYEKLATYSQELINKYQDKTKCLLMTENFAQCKMTTEEKEINLYCDTIKKFCPKNSVVFIKPHPIDKEFELDKFKNIIGNDWELVAIDKNFISYPVEMMQDLIKSCEVIISAGTPRITSKYLYDKDIICPFKECNITKYFDEENQNLITRNIKSYCCR